ncbi:MAG: hypothetical protein V4440_07575 [Pseudomonadota bacterium]
MPQPSQNVGAFVEDSYQLISANTPTVPLHGNDMSKGIQFLNELLQSYSANGLLITVAKQVDLTVGINQGEITFGNTGYTPTPDVVQGRLANLENAWINLDGVDYPLIIESRHEFFSSYKYEPLQGLPRFIIVKPETNLTRVQIFPAPSQVYDMHVYGKFQLATVAQTDSMDSLPAYYIRFLRLALAKDLAYYKARADAWTDKLQQQLVESEKSMDAASSINLDINVNSESWLNGAWRVRSGI